MSFLGYIIHINVLAAGLEKVKAVVKWLKPKNELEIRSFLGIIGYYKRFVEDFCKIIGHLTRLAYKRSKV